MRETKIVEFKLEDFDAARGTFAGYGSTFGNIDEGDDRVIEGAFTETLKEHKAKDQLPAMFWLHDWKQPVGQWSKMEEDSKGLAVEGALWVDGNKVGAKPIEAAEMVRNLLTSNGPKGLSIGYDVDESEFVTEGDDGKRLVRNLKKLGLYEVSPVPYGMNVEATVTGAKAKKFVGVLPTKRELEVILRDGGLSWREAKALISQGWGGLVRDDEAELVKALTGLKSKVNGE
jgi:hypothetical protein